MGLQRFRQEGLDLASDALIRPGPRPWKRTDMGTNAHKSSWYAEYQAVGFLYIPRARFYSGDTLSRALMTPRRTDTESLPPTTPFGSVGMRGAGLAVPIVFRLQRAAGPVRHCSPR